MKTAKTAAPLRAYAAAKADYANGIAEAERLSRDWGRRFDRAWPVALHRVTDALERMGTAAPAVLGQGG